MKISDLNEQGWAFVKDYHLATLSTLTRKGSIHVVAVGFTLDPEDNLIRIITSASQKTKNIREYSSHATVSQVEGPLWVSFMGQASISEERDEVARAEKLYTQRYRPPRINPQRVVICLNVERVLGSRRLFSNN